jgi:uncharacterized protein
MPYSLLRFASAPIDKISKYIVNMIEFEWDEAKNQSNQKKHGISFEEAKSVFYDSDAIQFFDTEHSSPVEERFLMLGLSSKLRLLLVCHCVKASKQMIRIISARKATKNEMQHYPKGK